MEKTKTRQQMFNEAYKGLKDQGWRRSIEADPNHPVCLYRGVDGCKCAIGQLIPDDKYFIEMEGAGTLPDFIDIHNHAKVAGLQEAVRKAAGIPERELPFARQMQIAHDSGTRPADMEALFDGLARRYELEVPS